MTKVFADFLPIIVFFLFFKWQGLMPATAAAIIVSLLQLIYYRIVSGKLHKLQVMSFLSILLLGGSTLICKKEIFIKWKPTAIYWLIATIMLITHIKKRPLLATFANNSIKLPQKIWKNINLSWAIFFLIMGLINLYVAYNFDTNTWVNFKLFGSLMLTITFAAIQAFYIFRHLEDKNDNRSSY